MTFCLDRLAMMLMTILSSKQMAKCYLDTQLCSLASYQPCRFALSISLSKTYPPLGFYSSANSIPLAHELDLAFYDYFLPFSFT